MHRASQTLVGISQDNYTSIQLLLNIGSIDTLHMAKVILNKVLKEKKITKYRFAKMLKMESSNLTKVFKPGYDPKLSTLEKWAKALDCSVTDLIED